MRKENIQTRNRKPYNKQVKSMLMNQKCLGADDSCNHFSDHMSKMVCKERETGNKHFKSLNGSVLDAINSMKEHFNNSFS